MGVEPQLPSVAVGVSVSALAVSPGGSISTDQSGGFFIPLREILPVPGCGLVALPGSAPFSAAEPLILSKELAEE